MFKENIIYYTAIAAIAVIAAMAFNAGFRLDGVKVLYYEKF